MSTDEPSNYFTNISSSNLSNMNYNNDDHDDNNNNNGNTIHDNNNNKCPTNTTTSTSAKLSWKIKFFYSLGHVYNDLTVSIWFSYTLLFFQFQFTGSLAGALILIGQAADAIASPLVGLQSDKSANMWLCAKYGRRKTWHLIGVIMNTISVPLVYNECFNCQNASQWFRFLYFSFLIIIFQGGWAATQVSHVSLITDLTSDTNERIALNAYRQAATIGANICLYTITLIAIGFNDEGTITKKDLVIFTNVSYIVCGIGLVFAALFHIFVHEPAVPPKPPKLKPHVFLLETKKYLQHTRGSQGIITLLANTKNETSSSGRPSISYSLDPEDFEQRLKDAKKQAKRWYHWFKSLSFWKITIMYIFSRMFVNVTQVYTSLYLQNYLILPKRMIAIIPFATYASGFVFSFVAKPLSARLSSRFTLVLGSVFGIITGVCIFVAKEDKIYKTYLVYMVFAFLGISGTALLISSLALTSDLIGNNTATGAFVFAAMSFFDKSVNGIVIAILEQFKPQEKLFDKNHIEIVKHETYYMYIMVALTIIPSVLNALGLLTIVKTRYGSRSRQNSISSSATVH